MHCKVIYTMKNQSMMNYWENPSDNWKTEEACSRTSDSTTYSDAETCSDEEDQVLFENRILCGPWGVHRFEKYPWSDKKRPMVRTKRYRDIKEFTHEELQGKLTRRIIATSLSYLDKSPYDLKYAYCKCQLQGKALIDISTLRPYHYIQYLDISNNCITTLSPLSEMPYLQYLDASFNVIENAFDFTPPLYLTTVNYAGNRIVVMPNMNNFWSMVHLNLSNNNIREVRGVEGLKYLMYLDLSHNKIRMLENLNNLNIETLLLNHNNICLYQKENKDFGFHTLKRLRMLDLSFNKLTSLYFLRQNNTIENLIMTNNHISEFLELFHLKDMTYLKGLDLQGNKISIMPHFRTMCLRTFKMLHNLNEIHVTAEEKVDAFTKEDVSLLYPAHVKRTQLLLLEQLRRPNTGAHVCPYDQPHPNVIMIVGPPASKKRDTVMSFVAENKLLQLGVTYTTRPMGKTEIYGKDYYFIQHSDFIEMLRRAEFLSVSEFNGYFYGITHQELTKGFNSILVFFSDIENALVMKMAGINPEIVLALPRDENLHLQWIRDNYIFDAPSVSDVDIISSKQCPASARKVSRIHHIDEVVESDKLSELSEISSFTIEDSSGESNTAKDAKSQDVENVNDPSDKFIFRPSHSNTSFKSYALEPDSQRQITKIAPVKLQSPSSEGEPRNKLIYKKSLPDDSDVQNSKSTKTKQSIDFKKQVDDLKGNNYCDEESVKEVKTMETGVCDTNSIKAAIVQKDKYKLDKKVSFNWSDLPDTNSSESILMRDPARSISNAPLIMELNNRFDQNILLSALSSSKMEVFAHGRASKTVYTSLLERIDSFKTEKLSSFYTYVLNMREKLLELHYQNPGLFHTVIFTDDLVECISTLKNVAKFMTEKMRIANKWSIDADSIENNPQFKTIVKNRLQKMDLHQNLFRTLYDEVEI